MTVRMVFRGAGLWDGAPASLADEWSEPPRSLAADRADVYPFPVPVESVPAEGHLVLLPDDGAAYVVAGVTHDFRRGLHTGPEVWLLLTRPIEDAEQVARSDDRDVDPKQAWWDRLDGGTCSRCGNGGSCSDHGPGRCPLILWASWAEAPSTREVFDGPS